MAGAHAEAKSGSMFKDSTLDEFFAQTEARNKELQARSSQVQKIFEQNQASADLIDKAMASQGENSQIVLRAKETASLEAQTKTLNQAAKLGVAPGVNSEILDAVSEEWKAAKLDSIKKQRTLARDLDVKFFDNPIDYIVAQIKMEGTITAAERSAARSSEATRNFADIQQLTQQMPGQMAAITATKSEATLQATLDINASDTMKAREQNRINAAGVQIQGIQLLDSMDAQRINNLHTTLSVKQQAASFELQKQQFEQSKKAFAIQMEERMERLAQKKADRDELELLANSVRKGAAVAGFENVTAYPTAKIIQMLNMKDAKTVDFLKSGMATEATGYPILSDDAGQSARIIAQHSAPLRPEQKAIKSLFQEGLQEAATPEAGVKGKYDNTKMDQVTQGARGIILAKATAQMANIKAGDNTNIYAPAPLMNVLDMGPVKKTAWAQKVMAPQIITGVLKETDPDQLISLTAVAIKEGKISYKDGAEGLQTFFSTATTLNNVTKNYKGMGLPDQVGFNTNVTAAFNQKVKKNLTSAQDIGNILNSRMIDNKMRDPSSPEYLGPFMAPGSTDL